MSEKKKKSKEQQTEETKSMSENKDREIHELKEEIEKLRNEIEEGKIEVENLKKIINEKNNEMENLKKTTKREIEDKKIEKENEEMKNLTEKLKNEKEEIISRLKYLQAEFENFRKRSQKEKEEFSKFCNEKLIISLIPIYEDLERGINQKFVSENSSEKELNSFKEQNESFISGIKMVYEIFRNTLKKEGLEEIKTIGEKFNPYEHEALMQVVNNEKEEGTILQEVQKGYILRGKVIRAAKVIVSKKGDEIIKKEKGEIELLKKEKEEIANIEGEIVKKEKEDVAEVKEDLGERGN